MSIPILLEMMRRRNTAIREREMNWFRALLSVATMLASHDAFAKHRMTDPLKIARECKGDLERLCKAPRPGHQRIINCLKKKVIELS
ncbi:MAG TPA: hypothetical protein VD863_04880, partial [Bradyrhizobium sp.]|nr:hypothetical protein [Bradyrhizobium sp.]